MNESNFTHFFCAFAWGIIVKRLMPPVIAFAVVMAGAILVELYQYMASRLGKPMSAKDTVLDLLFDLIGASASCFGEWC